MAFKQNPYFCENTQHFFCRNNQHGSKEKCIFMLNFSRDALLHRQGLERGRFIIPLRQKTVYHHPFKVEDSLSRGKLVKCFASYYSREDNQELVQIKSTFVYFRPQGGATNFLSCTSGSEYKPEHSQNSESFISFQTCWLLDVLIIILTQQVLYYPIIQNNLNQ